jgi:lysophospholipase L1-like esterase
LPEPGAPASWLALGDSYTIGEGVPEAGRWPNQLAARLNRQGIAVRPPRILATTGWTTAELSAAMDEQQPLGQWSLVSLLIGVNDQYRGRSPTDYRPAFRNLLTRAIALAQGRADRVLVVSIPDWGQTPFADQRGRDSREISARIDAFNAVAREESQRLGCPWVDVTGISRDRGGQPDMLAADGLHPSAAMYARWADHVYPAARAALLTR